MPSLSEITRSLAGAIRLLTFRPDGLLFMERDPRAAWRSFFAMVLVAPPFALAVLRLGERMTGAPPEGEALLLWALTYVCLWFAFPLVLLFLSRQQPFAPRVAGLIQASNWVAVPAAYLKAGSQLLGDGLGPLAEVLDWTLVFWLWINFWWLLRTLLGIKGGQAFALLLLSELIGYAFFAYALTRSFLIPAMPVA